MSDPTDLVHPSLYSRTQTDNLSLHGVRCGTCGHEAFPFQQYGCEACGAEAGALEPLGLAAQGTIVSFAQVHRHQGKDIEAPFIMAQIRLDGGVFVRCTMVSADDTELKSGQRVAGHLVAGFGLNEGKQELRFDKESN